MPSHVLCAHPDQWTLLGQHPELAVNAVEETMRHSPIAFGILRTATDDVELAGVIIPPGHRSSSPPGPPTAIPPSTEPDRLDITRDGTPGRMDIMP